MSKSRVVTGVLSAVFCLTIVSSARADRADVEMSLEKEIYAERHNLTAFDTERTDNGYLYVAHFENNSGRHLGFSVAGAHRNGPRFGVVKGTSPGVSQNPEPTAMILLGTGLAAVAALARRKNRKRATR